MEWKKIRNWLLVLLLCVDLFLAGNLVLQSLRVEHNLRQAAQDAVTIAHNRGVDIALETILQLPEELVFYQTQRSDGLEQKVAQFLLGSEPQQEQPGGGVAIYRSETGEAAFRRGGAVELTGPWNRTEFNAHECALRLEDAGFPMEGAVLQEQNGAVELVQSFEGLPVFNNRLICLLQDQQLQVRGRWMLAQEPEAGQRSLSRAQLVLALCDLVESRQVTQLLSIRAGYYLQSEDAQSLMLEPVWAVETDRGQLILSCISGKQVNF